jgi:hypothetical protein
MVKPVAAKQDRLQTVLSYKIINSRGVATIDAVVKIADQSPKSASALLMSLMDGLMAIPQAQVDGK